MPINNEDFHTSLYDLLRTKGYDPIPLDSKGNTTPFYPEADIFKFSFVKNGKKYGDVWATVDNALKLVLYYDDDVSSSSDDNTSGTPYSDSWPALIKHLKKWAQRRQLSFELKNKDHLVSDMAQREYMKKKERLGEGYYPMGKKASYNDAIPQVKIVIQHTKQIGEGEQRFRNVDRIFVENTEGERFAVPTKKPGLAKVYARHVAEGGTPYDDRGRHLTTLIEEYNKMVGFVRATKTGEFNESVQRVVNAGIDHYQSLRESLGKLTSHRGYHSYFDSWSPVLNEEQSDITEISTLFTKSNLDPRIESCIPILSKLTKLDEIKPVKELDSWADEVIRETTSIDLSKEGPTSLMPGAGKNTRTSRERDRERAKALSHYSKELAAHHYGKEVEKSDQGVAEAYHNNVMHAWNSGMSDEEIIQRFGKSEFDRLKKKYGDGSIPVPDLLGYKPKEPEDKRVRLHRGLEGPGKALKSIIKQQNQKQGVAEGSKDKVHLKTPKHGLADHPGRNTGVGLRTFASTPEQDRCSKCNTLYKNHYQKQGVAEMDNRTPSGDRREQRANSPEEIAKREKEQQADLKKVSPEMRKKLRLPEPKQGVAEGDTLDTGPDGKLTAKGEEQMRRYRQQKREQERQQIIAKHTKTVKGDTYGVAPTRISRSRNEVDWAACNKELRKKGLDEQGVTEGSADMEWHGSNTDMKWYDAYKDQPVRVKVKNHSGLGGKPSGTFKIRSFKKIGPSKAELTITFRGEEMTGTVDLDNPETVVNKMYDKVPAMNFYIGSMPATARQAFNLFQYKNKKQGVTEMDNRTPSGDRREQRANSPEEIAKREKEQQADLKKVSPEMRKKLRLPEPKQGVAEGSTDLVQIEYWQQDTMESGRWVKTKPMPRDTAEKVVGSFERGEIVDIEQGVAEGVEQINEINPMLVRDGLQVVIDFLSQYPQATALTAGVAGTAIVAKLVKNAWRNHKELEQLKQDVINWSIQKLHANKNVSAKGGKVAKIIQTEIKRRKQGVAEGDVVQGPWGRKPTLKPEVGGTGTTYLVVPDPGIRQVLRDKYSQFDNVTITWKSKDQMAQEVEWEEGEGFPPNLIGEFEVKFEEDSDEGYTMEVTDTWSVKSKNLNGRAPYELKRRARISAEMESLNPHKKGVAESRDEDSYIERRRARKYGYDTGLEREYMDLDAHERAMAARAAKEKEKTSSKDDKDQGDQIDEGVMDFLKKVGLATAIVGALGLPGAIEMHYLEQTPLVQEIKRRAEQGDEQAKIDLDNLSVTLGSGRTGPTMVLLNRYGFKNVQEPKSQEGETYEGLNAQQKKAGQLGPTEKANNISPVLGSPQHKHPFDGKLVGNESTDPDLKRLQTLIKHIR